jgi:hypothetical protein
VRVALFQLDGKLPNLALMRIGMFHKRRGDDVELIRTGNPEQLRFGSTEPDHVYGSVIFQKCRFVAEKLLRVYPKAIVGGTGWDYATTVESVGIDVGEHDLDYSLYPDYQHSIGFTQRGCRLKCGFCVVPKKEGKVREVSSIHDIWRGEPYPRNVLLLDNDFFGQEHWRERIAEISDGGFKVSFNQGINARFLTDEAAEAIASVKYSDDDFKTRRIYTAWDNAKDEQRLFDGLWRLVKYGVKPDHIMVYMLIGYWPNETDRDWLDRATKLRDFGARPYPMPYVRDSLSVGFQRWVIMAFDKTQNRNHIDWKTFKAANCQPNRVDRNRFALPLLLAS